jgi:hypothetical protein
MKNIDIVYKILNPKDSYSMKDDGNLKESRKYKIRALINGSKSKKLKYNWGNGLRYRRIRVEREIRLNSGVPTAELKNKEITSFSDEIVKVSEKYREEWILVPQRDTRVDYIKNIHNNLNQGINSTLLSVKKKYH